MPTRRADDSREVLLRAGEEVIEELLRSGGLEHLGVIRPTNIAARADRSKALLYLWPVDKHEPDKMKGEGARRRSSWIPRCWWCSIRWSSPRAGATR